mgnify:CR=1 FL=1
MAEAGGASGEKGVWKGVSAGLGAGVDGAGVEGLARRGTRLGVASRDGCAQIFPGGLACGLGLRDWLDWFAATSASALRGAVGASKPRSWLSEANIVMQASSIFKLSARSVRCLAMWIDKIEAGWVSGPSTLHRSHPRLCR